MTSTPMTDTVARRCTDAWVAIACMTECVWEIIVTTNTMKATVLAMSMGSKTMSRKKAGDVCVILVDATCRDCGWCCQRRHHPFIVQMINRGIV